MLKKSKLLLIGATFFLITGITYKITVNKTLSTNSVSLYSPSALTMTDVIMETNHLPPVLKELGEMSIHENGYVTNPSPHTLLHRNKQLHKTNTQMLFNRVIKEPLNPLSTILGVNKSSTLVNPLLLSTPAIEQNTVPQKDTSIKLRYQKISSDPIWTLNHSVTNLTPNLHPSPKNSHHKKHQKKKKKKKTSSPTPFSLMTETTPDIQLVLGYNKEDNS